MPTKYSDDGAPYEDQSDLRELHGSSWKRILAWYANKTFNGGLSDLNHRARNFLEEDPKATVLDIGTGDGEQLIWWSKKIGTEKLFSIDAVPNKYPEKIKTFTAALDQKWPISDDFCDVLISSQNIEHVIDTPLYMQECNRVLKSGGYVLILTENLASWANIGSLVLGWIPFSLTNMFRFSLGNPLVWHSGLPKDNRTEFYNNKLWGCLGHQRVFTLYALKKLGERYGFSVEAIFGEGYLPFWGSVSRIFSRLNTTHCHFIGIKLRKTSNSSTQKQVF